MGLGSTLAVIETGVEERRIPSSTGFEEMNLNRELAQSGRDLGEKPAGGVSKNIQRHTHPRRSTDCKLMTSHRLSELTVSSKTTFCNDLHISWGALASGASP